MIKCGRLATQNSVRNEWKDKNNQKEELEDGTYADGCGLDEEADEVETQLAMGCEGNARRDHKDNDGQFAVRILDAESPRYKEDSNGGKRLGKCSKSGDWKPRREKGIYL